MASRAPQESLVGPIPLNIFINYSDNRSEDTVSKSVYNNKQGEGVEGRTNLHKAINIDVDRVEDWANKHYMSLTKAKYKVLHPGWKFQAAV